MKPQTLRAHFLRDNLDLAAASGVEDAAWEPFQVAHLNDDGPYRIENKSRQIAWSFIIAAEAVAFALLKDPVASSSVFESINQAEAAQKISYARGVYENLAKLKGLPKLTKDATLVLEFDGGIDRGGSTIESLPAKPPRGKARRNFYGDEFAHVVGDREIYKGAIPVTSKGGRFRLGSSPMGASGMFWEIFTQTNQAYPGYVRKTTPWWQCFSFCNNLAEAIASARLLETEERVRLFGKTRLINIYENMVLEDFKQEFESEFVDETTAWVTWEEIKVCQDAELVCARATAKQGKLNEAFAAVDELAHLIALGTVELSYYGGLDIGRKRNTSELGLIGVSTTGALPLRLHISMDGLEFDDQEMIVEHALKSLPVTKLLIDRNGLGMQIAENMGRKFPSKAVGVDFTNATKQLWATNLKMLFQQRRPVLPPDRELSRQLHSIKKIVTANKNNVYDTDTNEKHHADMFWMLALALSAALEPKQSRLPPMSMTQQQGR